MNTNPFETITSVFGGGVFALIILCALYVLSAVVAMFWLLFPVITYYQMQAMQKQTAQTNKLLAELLDAKEEDGVNPFVRRAERLAESKR